MEIIRMIIGSSLPRVDGRAKVSGSARYIDDLSFPGLLYGKTLRSPVARGQLRGIAFPADLGDITIAAAADIPVRNIISLLEDDQPCLVASEIRHIAEPICLIACGDPRRLDEVASAI